GRGGRLLALSRPPDPGDRARGDRHPGQVRRPDLARNLRARLALAGAFASLRGHRSPPHLPSRLPAPQPSREAKGFGGSPAGDAPTRPPSALSASAGGPDPEEILRAPPGRGGYDGARSLAFGRRRLCYSSLRSEEHT